MTKNDDTMPWLCLGQEIDAEAVPASGREIKLTLDENQKDTLSKSLELNAITKFQCQLVLKPISRNRLKLTGSLTFSIEQNCVVSLEPVLSHYSETISASFWPEEHVAKYFAERDEEEIDTLEEEEPEAIQAGRVNLGRFVYELMATTINPYPKKEGIEFDWQDANLTESDDNTLENKPFAALKKLKKNGKSDED